MLKKSTDIPLLKTMFNHVFKLSSNWMFFHQECELRKNGFCSPTLSWNSRREYHQTFYWNESWGFNNQITSIRRTWCSYKNCPTIQRPEIVKCGKTPTRWLLPMSSPLTKDRGSKNNSSRKISNLQLFINKTLFIITSVVCVMQTRSASRPDTYIDVWRNRSD